MANKLRNTMLLWNELTYCLTVIKTHKTVRKAIKIINQTDSVFTPKNWCSKNFDSIYT